MNKSILIVYHSGAGSTKTIAELYCQLLADLCPEYQIHLELISPEVVCENVQNHDVIIMGFPTYHGEPPASMRQFAEKMPTMRAPKKLFLFTTYGLYPANSLRILGKQLKKKHFVLCGTAGYRAPATDAALLLPKIPPLLDFEKNTAAKLLNDLRHIRKCLDGEGIKEAMPRFKAYAILNYPNQYLGKRAKHTLKVVADDCIQCQRCIDGCLLKCWQPGKQVPLFDGTYCEHCFRCIHHCPGNAIVLSRKTQARVKLTPSFYADKKNVLMEQLSRK